jgi:hypothetical protein
MNDNELVDAGDVNDGPEPTEEPQPDDEAEALEEKA